MNIGFMMNPTPETKEAMGAEIQEFLATRFGFVPSMEGWDIRPGQQHDLSRVISLIRDHLEMVAEMSHSQYSQYKDHWKGWRLGRMTRDVELKGGRMIRKDDYVLVNPQAYIPVLTFNPSFSVFSLRIMGDAGVNYGDFEILSQT